ncbi:MAG: hypothetical protein WA990_07200 [Rubrobacteraceae bacterium]
MDYVKKNYKVAEQTDRMLRLVFSINDRSQLVFVWYTPMQDGEEWVQIESPVGELDKLNLRELLELVEKKIVGGVAAFEGYAVLRDAVSLSDMSVEEFETPFHAIVVTADRLEHQLTGVDQY